MSEVSYPQGPLSKVPAYQAKSFPSNAAAVTPHDTNDLTNPGALYIGVGGNVKVDFFTSGTAVSFLSVPTGSWIVGLIKRVYATDTSATNIVVLF